MQKTRSLGFLFVLAALVAGAWWLLGGGGGGGLGGDPAAAGKEAEQAAAALQVDGGAPAPATLETSGDRVAITPAQASDASGPAIVGCVVDAASKPVAGARVRCTPSASNSFDGDVDFSDSDAWVVRARELAKQRVEVQTGDDGRFRVAASGTAANFDLQVLARGHVAHSQSVPRPRERDYDAGTLKLKGAAVLSGRVLDRAGKAVGGATVQRESAQEAASDMEFDNPWAAEWTELTAAGGALMRTDAEGRFELAHAEPGEFALSARHPDYPTARLLNLKAAPGAVLTDLVITVEPGATIRGKVVGVPAETAGLRVVAARKRDGSQPREGFGVQFGEQDLAERGGDPASDGAFTLRGVTPGRTYRVWLTQRGRGFTGPSTCSQKLEVSGGAEGVELRYVAGVTVTLQVADARSGAPVERLWVSDRLKGGEGGFFDFFTMNVRARDYPGGKVTLANLRPAKKQTLSLSVEATGFKKFEREGIELPLTGSVDLGLVQLQPVPVVRVQVTAALDGQPVAGATVALAAKGRPERADLEIRRMFEGNAMVRGGRSVKTDAEGRCTLNSIPGAEAVVSVTTKDFAPYASAPLTLPAADDVEHAVRLVPGGAVAVEVVDTEGKPVAKATVAHTDAAERQDSLQADARGLVVFERLSPGEHRFRLGDAGMRYDAGNGMFNAPIMVGARSQPPSPRNDDWQKVAVLDGERATLRLVKPLTATVTGIVRENGVPLVGADVGLVRGVEGARAEGERFRGSARARTDELGRYTLNEAPMGDHRLRVTHRDRAMPVTLPVTLVAGANTFDVALDVAIVRGVVRGPDGKPVAGAAVRAVEPTTAPSGGARREAAMREEAMRAEAMARAGAGEAAAGRSQGRTDAEGRYELRGVASSKSIVVRVSAKGFGDATSAPFQVALGGTRENVDVALTAAGTVRVKASEDVQFATVEATFAEDEANVAPVHAMVMRGAATIEGLRPGSWKLTLNVPGRPESTTRTVEVKGGTTVEAAF